MIGFDIGGTKCAVSEGMERANGLHIRNKRILPTDHKISAYKMIDRMYECARDMAESVDVIGISCGGPLNTKKGMILSPPNLSGWDSIGIVEYLREKYGVRAYLENDANACAVAEWKFGAGRGCNNMVFLTFGTGMGAGLILNGQLYSGTSDMAGEIGHVRMTGYGPVGYGKQGSFEGFCSGNGLAQIGQMTARERFQRGEKVSFCEEISKLDTITAKTVAEFAKQGYEDALEVYHICGKMLGKGLAMLIDILNPEKIVLGSIYCRSEKLLKSSMEEVLKKECLSAAYRVCEIVPAELGEKIGDYAAIAVGILGEEKNRIEKVRIEPITKV